MTWGRLRPFDRGDERMPPIENQRTKAIVLMQEALTKNDAELAQKAGKQLLPDGIDVDKAIAAIGDDIPTLVSISEVLAMAKQGDLAAVVWRQILEHDPNHEAS